jgi:hypothetical protein
MGPRIGWRGGNGSGDGDDYDHLLLVDGRA